MNMPRFKSITTVIVGRYKVRIQREELHQAAACDPQRQDVEVTAQQLRHDQTKGGVPMSKVFDCFAGLPRVVNIEITDPQGNGITL